eukprot:TRINITY_DN17917_c0_g1_i1.p1 TRINITY_DN17917_c0_g1~~TRINITY_DN17917_c0_g1_i1.p1  ORF type:complete len:648 (+),score=173.77 TRINITY_DN17917_c0_g1_i1:88-2031(+)
MGVSCFASDNELNRAFILPDNVSVKNTFLHYDDADKRMQDLFSDDSDADDEDPRTFREAKMHCRTSTLARGRTDPTHSSRFRRSYGVPQQVQQPKQEKQIQQEHERQEEQAFASGAWTIDAKTLSTTNTRMKLKDEFDIPMDPLKPASLLMLFLVPQAGTGRGKSNFKSSRGQGKVQVNWIGTAPDSDIAFTVSVGNQVVPVTNNFVQNYSYQIPDTFDFQAAVDKTTNSFTVRLEAGGLNAGGLDRDQQTGDKASDAEVGSESSGSAADPSTVGEVTAMPADAGASSSMWVQGQQPMVGVVVPVQVMIQTPNGVMMGMSLAQYCMPMQGNPMVGIGGFTESSSHNMPIVSNAGCGTGPLRCSQDELQLQQLQMQEQDKDQSDRECSTADEWSSDTTRYTAHTATGEWDPYAGPQCQHEHEFKQDQKQHPINLLDLAAMEKLMPQKQQQQLSNNEETPESQDKWWLSDSWQQPQEQQQQPPNNEETPESQDKWWLSDSWQQPQEQQQQPPNNEETPESQDTWWLSQPWQQPQEQQQQPPNNEETPESQGKWWLSKPRQQAQAQDAEESLLQKLLPNTAFTQESFSATPAAPAGNLLQQLLPNCSAQGPAATASTAAATELSTNSNNTSSATENPEATAVLRKLMKMQ